MLRRPSVILNNLSLNCRICKQQRIRLPHVSASVIIVLLKYILKFGAAIGWQCNGEIATSIEFYIIVSFPPLVSLKVASHQ